jgi:lysophospholipase L1-like esterase
MSKSPGKFWKRWGKRLLHATLLLVIALVTFEICVRVSGYSDHYLYDPIYRPLPEAADIPYVHKPNLHAAAGRGGAVVNTDSLGNRAATAGAKYGPKKNNEYRIAVVGDSITFGEGVRKTEDTYCAVLGELLNRRAKPEGQNVRVFNFGVSAYSVREMAATLDVRVPAVQPDLVLMAIIPSDMDMTRTGEVDRWGYTSSRKLSGFLDRDSYFKRMLRSVHMVYLLRDVRYRLLGGAGPQTTTTKLPETYRYIKRFAEIARSRGWDYAIVLLPVNESFEQLRAQLAADGIPFIDASFLLGEFTTGQYRASRYDGHPSERVHHRIAEVLAEKISPLL